MPAGAHNCLRQPDGLPDYGPFKIYLRTDGKYVVHDLRKHFASLPEKIAMRLEVAKTMARELWELGGRPTWE
jgi:hypothetical protein